MKFGKEITTKEQHQAALEHISRLILIEPAPGSIAAQELELMTQRVTAYEQKYYGHVGKK